MRLLTSTLIILALLALLHAYIGWCSLPELPVGTATHIAGGI